MNLRLLLFVALLVVRPQTHAAEPAAIVTNSVIATNAITETATNTLATTDTNGPASSTTNAPTKPQLSPAMIEGFRGMQLRAGYRLQIVAAEPLVHSPVALAFDASGRLFVAERPTDPTQGCIKVLEDTDGDGAFDKSRVFADNVPSPTALICYGGGVFVASGSKIIFLADTTGKGMADLRREVFGGFETGNAGVNYGSGVNNFVWGLDNRIHAATAGVGGNISCLAISTSQTLSLDGYDLAFNPRSLSMVVETDGANRGVSFDNAGRRYTSTATRPAQLTVCDPIRATRNPLFIWPQLTSDLTPPNSAPARQIRSLHVYRGGALSSAVVDDVFFADTALGVVNRLHLRENGFVPALEFPKSETSSAFLSSRDPTFRPIQVVSGPDGTLYVADLAREKLDNVSEDGGRIWRISPVGLKPQMPPQLAALKTPDLVNLLASPNGWARDTAARLLFERRDTNAIPLLVKQLTRAKEPLARLHSLRALGGLDALTEADVIAALRDGDERVREHAVQLAETFTRNGDVSNALWSQLTTTPEDASLRVRFQAAFTVGTMQRRGVTAVLADILRSAPGERAIQFAVLTAAGARADEVFMNLVGDTRLSGTPTGWEFLCDLAVMTGAQKNTGMDQVLTAIERAQLRPLESLTLARCLGEGLATAGRTFAGTAPQGTWRGFGTEALNIGLGSGPAELRAEAIRFLGVSGYSSQEIGDWLLAFLVPGESQAVQSATITSLSHFQDPLITTAFLQRWASLSEISQREIISRLLARFDRTMALMSALEQKRIPLTALSDVQVNFLRSHRDANTAARAVRIFGPQGQTGLAERFAMVLQLKGTAARGRELFNARCAGCHSLGGNGRSFGPNLDNVTHSRDKLLQDILEPDREIRPAYRTSVVQRTDSELIFGIVSKSGPDVLLVRQPSGATIFLPRTQVEDSSPQDWSLMPEDAAAGMSAGDLADLIEFITLPR